MTRISFYFTVFLCIYALAIIGLVNAGGDVPSSKPECGLVSLPCATLNCPEGVEKIYEGAGFCCCYF
ncbi:CLUMA_CG017065, isoform A [Clunio marinus]|uniref:CLUMA_CG017065, isoform A n=1 Tax=Clunio marinus TaxID=568069 RepID=A0A1J1IV08_9DIPT|nr:CLUMA_CG017065, isoform A [Clunio marinus]